MKATKMTGLTIILIVVSFLMTTVISVRSLRTVINDNAEDMTTILSARIYDTINSELSEPIMVARTMSNDSFLKQQLRLEDSVSEEEMLSRMEEYLYTIKNELGYNTSFVVSENSRKYYTYEGLNKIVLPELDEHDIWYSIFLDGGKKYDFDVDTDEVNSDSWTIFVNSRIEDEDGTLLGVCGVGVVMSNIQEIFREFEQQYNVKVNLINQDGLVQVDTNSVNIENSVLENVLVNAGNSAEYVYTKEGNGYVVTKYLEDFGWYLVIRNMGENNDRIYSDIVIQNILAMEIIMLILLVCVRVLLDREKKKLEESAVTDRLTGLANRNYFKISIEEKEEAAIKGYQSMVVFDIDNFKTINDTMGHLEGDEILKQVAELAKEAVEDKGQIIRWGGDEFLILFKGGLEESSKICEQLRRNIESETRVSVSMGICKMEGNIKNSFMKADKLLYQAKKQGKNQLIEE